MPTKKESSSKAKTKEEKPSKKPVKKTTKKAEKKVTNTEAVSPNEAKKAKAGQKETKKATSVQKQKIRVIIRAFDHKIADETAKTIIETAERAGSLVTGPIPMPTKIEKFTVNRSTFVNKDAREQFEIRTHKRLIDITEHSASAIESLSNLNLPAGVDLEIKMV